MKTIDLRSDTVTQPTDAMRAKMVTAPVGDDVYGEDPTVNALQEKAAAVTGKEAALFAPSGTQSNLLALIAHCERGDEYIVGQQAHTYKFEGGGAAILGSIQPQPLDFEPDGTLDFDKIRAAIKPRENPHFAKTRLLCLENTHNGKVLPMDYVKKIPAFAIRNDLATHMDGARIFNAAVAQNLPVADIVQHVDTVSICLSKGLGAPVGSVLCGPQALIKKAYRWRKVLGGGMRQAGILAAAGLFALGHHVDRLADDHANAAKLADGLRQFKPLCATPISHQTNMVFVQADQNMLDALGRFLAKNKILVSGMGGWRLVTHLDVTDDDVDRVLDTTSRFFKEKTKHD